MSNVANPSRRPDGLRRAVLPLLATLGVATVLAGVYVARRGQPTSAAGSLPFDVAAARGELETLGQRINNALGDGGDRLTDALRQEAQALVERYPRFAPARTLWAQMLISAGDQAAAYQQLERSLELDAGHADIQDLAGALAERLGRLDRAGWHYSQAISLDGRNAMYRLKLANVYSRQRQVDRARELILEALRLDSSQHLGYAMLADLYASQNKLDLALDQIAKAIEHTPLGERPRQISYVRTRAAYLRRANRPQEALQVLKTLAPRECLDPAVLADVALCWAMLGQPDKAAAEYEAALETQPTTTLWAVEAARWRLKAGDPAAGAKNLQIAQTLDPAAPTLDELKPRAP